MTPTHLIAILGILVASGTGLFIAFMQRRLMKQLELFRKGQAASVDPPPLPPVRFLKRYWRESLPYLEYGSKYCGDPYG